MTNTEQPTVGRFLFEYLQKEGITEIFGVPGDYNFSLLDILDNFQGVNFVNCSNELNAGYAADGYARLNGIGVLITTFGVGELSACNAIAGSYSESVPVIHIVGAPKSMVIKEHKKMHHTLLDGDFDVFRKVYENLTAYTAFVTAENAAIEIPAAISKAKETKKPVYLVVPIDVAPMKLLARDFMPEQKKTSLSSLQEALKLIRPMIGSAQHPVLISELYVFRYGMEARVEQLAEKLNIPVTTMMMGKGSYDESKSNFIGFYNGKIGSDEVRNIVESSDCVLAVGAIWDDYNTGYFTAALNPLQVIEIMPNYTKVGKAVFENIMMEDILDELLKSSTPKNVAIPKIRFPFDDGGMPTEQPLTAKYYYPRMQKMIRENDIVVAEAGTLANGMTQLRLKRGVTYITQGGWGCIGYAIPAAFGAAIAAKNRRVLLFTGDGSLQLTVQELSSMLRNDCKPIIFVLNNGGYTIEKYINTPAQTGYNDIPKWNYIMLTGAFGGNAFVTKASTEKQFDEAIVQAEEQSKTKLCLIEMVVPPMDAPEIVHKIRMTLEEMQKRK
jgi:indolepyruvate decarboxylase